jgi:hypothetical protein
MRKEGHGNCKICTIIKSYPQLQDPLNYDLAKGMAAREFLAKWNLKILRLGIDTRLLYCNWRNHRSHTSREIMLKVIKSVEGKPKFENLDVDMRVLHDRYSTNNVFLENTFMQRLDNLQELHRMRKRKLERKYDLISRQKDVEKKLAAIELNLPPLGKESLSVSERMSIRERDILTEEKFKIEKRLEHTEAGIKEDQEDINGMVREIDDSYLRNSKKYGNSMLIEDMQDIINKFFLDLNIHLNEFQPALASYLMYDEFPTDNARAANIMHRVSKIVLDNLNRSINTSIIKLPKQLDIANLMGVRIVEESTRMLPENASEVLKDN